MAHLQEQEHSSPPPSSETMKHEEPRTFPSSRGHSGHVSASASAAAALGWAKHKPLDTRTMPQNSMSPSAARAASLAADQRSPSPRRQPRSASAFPQTLRGGSPSPGLGSSAAAQAYRARSPRLEPQAVDKDSPSLLAAQEAVGAARPRSISSPVPGRPVPDQESGDGSDDRDGAALQRWEFAPGPGPAGNGAAPTTTLPRAMFTANPPVEQEVEEKRKADELHASAVVMAKNIFEKQPKLAERFLREDDLHKTGEPTQSGQHPGLHETAYKLAIERLANFHRQNQKDEGPQSHYTPSGALRRRFTIAGRFRGRASNDGDLESRQRDRAPNGASLLSPRQDNPDEAHEADQSHVLAAARRNVRSQLDDMDQSVADRTGMVPPGTKSAWESRARAVAQANTDPEGSRDGQRDVGGGQHFAQDDVEAVARQNLKPLFSEIDERAEKERERERRLKEEKHVKRVEAERKRAYDREVEDLHRKLKAEQKEKEKERQKALKEEERARKREEKAGKRRRRSSTVIIPDIEIGSSDPADPDEAAAGQEPLSRGSVQRDGGPRRTSGNTDDGGNREQASPPGKFRSWFRTKFTRQKSAARDRDGSEVGRGFVGGHSLRSPSPGTSDAAPSSSMRDLALAGRMTPSPLDEARARTPSRGEGAEAPLEREVSSGADESFEDARESVSPRRSPARVGAGKSGSPTGGSRFVEMMD